MRILIPFLIFLTCFSCNDNKPKPPIDEGVEIRNRIKNQSLSEIFTDIELKGFEYKEIEISDREAYEELFRHNMDRAESRINNGLHP